jgi:hypothetical protein
MRNLNKLLVFLLLVTFSCNGNLKEDQGKLKTRVSIEGEKFYINGKPTFEGRSWQGYPVEGLLPNSRMVQGIFDDYNPETAVLWKYPDTGEWSADRNTDEFIAAMPSWREHGLLAFTINLQGGSPMGYGNKNWENTAIGPNGDLRPEFMARLEKITDKADGLGMVVILGVFYFGQDEFLEGEEAIKTGLRNTIEWLAGKGYQNVIIEVANESDNSKYDHGIISNGRIHELIELAQQPAKNGHQFLVGTSFNGKSVPPKKVVQISDFVLVHGNGAHDPNILTHMADSIRSMDVYSPKPIVFNEDDHFDFDKPENNFVAATKAYASWGYFDFRMDGESFENGFQSVPVDWTISSERKIGFFNKMKEIFID